MKESLTGDIDLEQFLSPENDLERSILEDPEFLKGLFWGKPRYGHPEGEIYKHIREVLDNVDKLSVSPSIRSQLRFITFVHDSFKHIEDKSRPRDWTKHHSIYARNFAAKYIQDPNVLDIIELHDEAYYIWRMIHLYQQPERGQERLQSFLQQIGQNLQTYYLFFKCDTCTGDKNLAPLKWFESQNFPIKIVFF